MPAAASSPSASARTIDELTVTFQSAGEEIRVTTANLGARNKDMSQRTANAVEAAACASRDVAAVAEAARGLLGADRRLLERGGGRQGRHRPHHRRSRPYRFHRAQPRRRGRAHRRRGQADRGDRLADLAARAQRHHRSGARRRRRPRLRRRRLRGQDAGAADRQGDRRDRRADSRHPARGQRNRRGHMPACRRA